MLWQGSWENQTKGMYTWKGRKGERRMRKRSTGKGMGRRRDWDQKEVVCVPMWAHKPKICREPSRLEPQARANTAVLVPRPSGWFQNSVLLLELNVFFSSGLQLMDKAYPHHYPQDSFKNTYTETLTIMFHHTACSTAQPRWQKPTITYAGMSHRLRSQSTEICETVNNDESSLYNVLGRKARLVRQAVGKALAPQAWKSGSKPKTNIKMPGMVVHKFYPSARDLETEITRQPL